jgi:hypothetical protein
MYLLVLHLYGSLARIEQHRPHNLVQPGWHWRTGRWLVAHQGVDTREAQHPAQHS